MTLKILLTGSSGMVGKNILTHSFSKQYEFITPSHSQLDLLNYNDVYTYVKKINPDFIIHAAGIVGGIQANINNHTWAFLGNLEIGNNLVKSAKENNIKNLLNLGSSCIYSCNHSEEILESSLLKGELEPTNEGYALAKISVAKLCEYISLSNNDFHYKTIIPCNLYGKWDKFDPKNSHMIPSVIRKIFEAKNNNATHVEIWGDGTARREFMYAEDFADSIYFCIQNFLKLDQYANVGLGFDYSINEYYKIASEIIGYKGEFYHNLSKPVGMKRKLLNIDKLSHLGWKAKTGLAEGIEKTCKFFLENYS